MFIKSQGRQMQRMSEDYESYIDRQINKQYHQICFNPNQKQTLFRLMQKPHLLSQTKRRHSNLLDNQTLMLYVHNVYQKYHIEDPIKKHFRLSSISYTDNTPEKSQNITQLTDSDRLTRTKRRLLSLKDSFKRDSEDVANSSEFVSIREQQSMIHPFKGNKQIGYKTKQKIRFKTIPNQEPVQSDSIQRSQNIMANGVNKQVQYCIICEQKLQQSIHNHLPKCKQGHQANLPDSQLQLNVLSKIQRMQKQILQILFFKNQQNILYRYRDLNSTIQKWISSNSLPFESIKNKFQFFSLDLFNRLSKLNWFRNTHLRMRYKSRLTK